MSNTVKYDRQDVIEKAMALFWEKGFHATSMRTLQVAINLCSGSIYASFGSKEGLFKEVLQYYTEKSLARLAILANESSSPLETVKTAIRNAVRGSASSPSGVCLLVKTVAELTEENAELLAEAKQLLNSFQDAIADLLTQAKESGELDESQYPRRLARFLQMQLMGLGAFAQTYGNDIPIDELINDAFACLH